VEKEEEEEGAHSPFSMNVGVMETAPYAAAKPALTVILTTPLDGSTKVPWALATLVPEQAVVPEKVAPVPLTSRTYPADKRIHWIISYLQEKRQMLIRASYYSTTSYPTTY